VDKALKKNAVISPKEIPVAMLPASGLIITAFFRYLFVLQKMPDALKPPPYPASLLKN
jgi:hypothetical protein